MNGNKYNHVGRPTNEEVKKYKKKNQLKIILIIIILLVGVGGIYIAFNYKNIDFSSIMGNSASSNNVKNRISVNPVYSLYTENLKSNALQGSAGISNNIYFTTVLSGSGKKDNYKSYAYNYNLKTKKLTEIKDINQEINSNYKIFKNNDVVANTRNHEIRFLYYDAYENKRASKLFKSTGNVPIINNTNNYNFTNIGYSKSWDKYVSIDRNKIYFYNLDDVNGNINIISECNLDNSLKNINNTNIVIQGIIVKGRMLYVAYQSHVKNNVGTLVSYNNHINLYDMRNCLLQDKKTSLSKKYDLGYDSKKYELESMFFMNGKLYLGYNGRDFRNIYFYTLNTKSTANVNLSLTEKNGQKYLTGTVTNNNNGTTYYSFCKSPNTNECKFKSVTSKGRYAIAFGNYRFSRKVTESGTYYLHIHDNFDKVKVSNPVVVDLES